MVNDLRYAALSGEGYGKHISDATNNWLLFATGTIEPTATVDLWDTLFDQDGIADGQRNDRQYAWYIFQGAVGSTLNDAAYDYWFNRANPP